MPSGAATGLGVYMENSVVGVAPNAPHVVVVPL